MKLSDKDVAELKKLTRAIIVNGIEMLNPTPVAIPIGMERPPSLQEQIQRVLRAERQDMLMDGDDDDAQDFDVLDEEPDPMTPYELKQMVDEIPEGYTLEVPEITEENETPPENPPENED